MPYLLGKYLLTAAVVVLVSELAKRSDRLGGLIAALPLITVLTLIWLHVEGQPVPRIANHAFYTFWYVLPTLPMFLLFPRLLRHLDFWPALAVFALGTLLIFWVYALLLKRFGLVLL